MSEIHPEDFEKILAIVKKELKDTIQFEEIIPIESNFDTKGMMFKSCESEFTDGTIIVGKDNGLIAIDISKADGEVISFLLKDADDNEGIDNIIKWFQDSYIKNT